MKRVLVAAVLLLLAGCSSDGEARWQTAEVKDLDSGAVVVLGEVLPQTTTIVTLWSVWCVPCRQELPHLEKLKQSDGAISVVGVNIGDDEASTREFLGELGVTFANYRDEDAALLTALKVPAVPATFIVDAEQSIAWKHLGALNQEDLSAAIDQYIEVG
jgi:cytochrome c biogenesis protein CcmG/thiol:disulfide interchange protein DsbE